MSTVICDSSCVAIHYLYSHEKNMKKYGQFLQEIHVNLSNYCVYLHHYSCFSSTHENLQLFPICVLISQSGSQSMTDFQV